jgi:hypothetical protein
MARNIATKKLVAVSGLKEMQDRVKGMIDAVDGAQMQSDLGDLAKRGAVLLEANALAQNWPKDAIKSIFVYTKLDPKESRRKRGPGALFGFRKRGRSKPYAPGFREWFPGRSASMRAKSLVIPGFKGKEGALQKIGMSLATMFEFGTSKMAARPALRPTIAALRAIYPAALGGILQKILAKHTIGGGR